MAKFIKRLSKTAGLTPGTLVHVGEKKQDRTKITIIDYDEHQVSEKQAPTIEECFPFKKTPTVTWINIDGLSEIGIIEKLGKQFDLHPLVLEDILNTGQRPKYDDYEDSIFIVIKMLQFPQAEQHITAEQVSLIFGSNFVISFQEKEGDVFDHVRERIRKAKGRIRRMGPDYLAYALLDAVVDSHYLILEKIGDTIEGIEEELVTNPNPQTLQTIHSLKKETIFLRKSVWPLREVVNSLERSESKLIAKATHIYLRDVYDHTIQVIDTIETFRDVVSGMVDMYLSSISNKMNEVMKVLTMIATIFIPITFVAGIYGMNFNHEVSKWNMPELTWRFGYLGVWAVMLLIIFLMVLFFKRKKWL
ncbi:magnesium/cobalt transporter CorA [Candidatus Omnitrophota bacterium]